MSDSDDDVPLGQRMMAPKEAAAAPPAAAKPKIVKDDNSDSEDDKPIAARQPQPKKIEKPKTAEKPKPKSTASGSKPRSTNSEAKPALKKAATAKARPSSGASAKSSEPRVKRVFDMPGQTRDTPGEEDPLRRFYTSLLEQDPTSEMARRWCAMTGLLPRDQAEKWVKEQTKRKLSGKSSPIKSAAKKKAPSASVPKRKVPAPEQQKSKKVKAEKRSDDEADFKSAKKAKHAPTSKASSEKKPPAKELKQDSSDSSDDDDASEVMPQTKQRSTVAQNKTNRDVAFTDGGMDGTDSDDDIPLGQRMKAVA